MFNARKLQRVLAALLCAAALLTVLDGCVEEREQPNAPAQAVPKEDTDKEPTPAKLLASALDAARADLTDRFGASPLAGLTELAPDGILTVQGAITLPGKPGQVPEELEGSIVLDRRTGQARADLAVSADKTPLGIWYSPEFAGISCGKLFGDEAFYGLRPYGLAEQLSGSALAELLGLNMEAVGELDKVLDSTPEDVDVFKAPEVDKIFALTHELIDTMELRTEKETLTLGGRELKAVRYEADLPANGLADYLKRLFTAAPDWVLLYGLGTGDENAAAVGEVLEDIRRAGGQTYLTFTVAEGKLYSVRAEYGQDGWPKAVEAQLYGENGDTLRLTAPDFELTVDLSDGAAMELNVSDGSSTRFGWTREGEFEFITYRGDITGLCLSGTLSAEDGRLRYEGTWCSGQRGEGSPLRFSTAPGGTITPPDTTRSLTELSSRQLSTALMRTLFDLF